MVPILAQYTGHCAGSWTLNSFLGTRGEKAFYVAALNRNERTALGVLAPAGGPGTASLRQSWELARGFGSPHLLALYETGETTMNGTPVLYAIMDLPDDDIGEITASRPLQMDEARGMALSVAKALDFLHSRGLCHGSVEPSNMFLIGDAVKLGVDTVHPSDAAGQENDLRQLGVTILGTVTRQADLGALSRLSPPLREVAAGCLAASGRQWSAARVVQTLTARSFAAEEPLHSLVPSPSEPEQRPAAPRLSSREIVRRRWPVPAAAVVALAGAAGYHFLGSNRDEPAATQPAESRQVPADPLGNSAQQQDKPSPSRPSAPPVMPAKPEVSRGPARAESGSSWAVIAATYTSYSAAQKRADSLGRLSERRINARVFPPDGQGSRYYVVLGSGLTAEAAERLRDSAIRDGAPQDSYVTKLNDR